MITKKALGVLLYRMRDQMNYMLFLWDLEVEHKTHRYHRCWRYVRRIFPWQNNGYKRSFHPNIKTFRDRMGERIVYTQKEVKRAIALFNQRRYEDLQERIDDWLLEPVCRATFERFMLLTDQEYQVLKAWAN